MTLAQWYLEQARTWAREADTRRYGWADMWMIRVAQDRAAVYATLAQQTAERYGEAR